MVTSPACRVPFDASARCGYPAYLRTHWERPPGATLPMSVHVPSGQSPVAILQRRPAVSAIWQTVAQYEETMLLPSFRVKQHCSPALQSEASSQAMAFLSPHEAAQAASGQLSLPQQKSSPVHLAFPHPIERCEPSLARGVVWGVLSDEHATSPTKTETASAEVKRSTPRAYHRAAAGGARR